MAQQFVVIWSVFLYASCLLLYCCNAVPQQQQQQQYQQQATKAPLADVNNVVEVGGQMGAVVGGGMVPAASVNVKEERVYHPAAVTKPRVIDQYDHRSLDGHFEYRYLLSNGEARYERAYWLPAGKSMVLARKGYYSYPLSHDKFLTVFYTADQNGYRQDSATYSRAQPTLPRSIEVPEYAPSSVYATQAPVSPHSAHQHVYSHATTQRPYIKPTGNPFLQINSAPPRQPASVNQAAVHQQIGAQGQSLSGQQSQVHHSSAYAPSAVHSAVESPYPSAVHSSHVGHHSSGIHSTAGISHAPSVSPHSPSEVHKPVGVPSAPSQVQHTSGVYSPVGVLSNSNIISSAGIYPSSVVQTQAGIPSSSSAHASSNVHHSSAVHSHGEAHSSVLPASQVHSSTGGHSSVSSLGGYRISFFFARSLICITSHRNSSTLTNSFTVYSSRTSSSLFSSAPTISISCSCPLSSPLGHSSLNNRRSFGSSSIMAL
ncbi:uncharacterized protein LOC105665338 [Ceratitis capitata]|uniref:uncharacterized protein LOC105665338 n=1 Tax=Ceratitis capitata TaxID=7213 RepID=UPI000618878F|nr:uncharacterized protein LOC105665338 [Ceratitis capitata]